MSMFVLSIGYNVMQPPPFPPPSRRFDKADMLYVILLVEYDRHLHDLLLTSWQRTRYNSRRPLPCT